MSNTLKNIMLVLDKKEKQHFFVLVLLDIIISIADILSLVLLLWIIQFYIQPVQNSNIWFLPNWLSNNNSVLLIAVFVLFFGLKNWAGFLVTRTHFRFINKVAIRITGNNLFNYQQSAYLDFINTDSSVYIRKICFQPFEFSQYLLSGIHQMITQLALILFTIIAVVIYDAKLFLLLLIILLPPVTIIFYFIKNRLAKAKKHIQTSNERSFQYLLDALKGFVESNIYNRNAFFMKRFITSRQKFSTYLFDSLAIQSMPGRIIEIIAVLGLFILIVITRWTGNNDTSTLITIGAFMAAAYKIIPGVVKIINITGQIKAYENALENPRPDKKANDSTQQNISIAGIDNIEFKDISFGYEGREVLQHFSLGINKGDFIGITGASGKGKTTILNLLLGFLQADMGEILINDKPVQSDELKNYWPFIACVRQQPFFIHDTLLKNITFREEGHDTQKLQYALGISGLEKLIEIFPEGHNKIITENGKNISGGQQQRIAIARALYKESTLLLLDEPFNELDETSTETLLVHFREMALSGNTVIMITHDKKSLSYCNKIISLDEA